MHEFKKLVQPIKVEATDWDSGLFTITNKHDFVDLRYLEATVTMMKDGQILSIQSLDSLVAKAGESQTVNLDLSPVRNHETGEYHLLFSFRLRETLPWLIRDMN
ncbi:hypothetical protein JCM19239_2081 [Vibrio variabilis]|uniref:beta-galactosidase n=1 Tax=Vibrio variabilis TaxID=990271 RepID=A0ABQ0JET3_9VIBR|nr:hypothetical protein JCM19239_2081 [Vibrio variabilis]